MMKWLTILLFTCTSLCGHAQVGIITTIAGTGETGYSGDNGPATAAKLNRPYCLLLDSHNNLFFADAFNHAVRKISLSTGIISNFAGTGTAGFNGDNIDATSAQLFVPEGLCADSDGNIYISDGGNQRIRKVSSATGKISTIAGTGAIGYGGDGGPAVNAQFNGPGGLYIRDNQLYICDYNGSYLRKVNLSTGIIDKWAGTGVMGYFGDNGPALNAQFNGIIDVVCDNFSNLLISDEFNNVIRKINKTTGIITTIIGNGISGYFGDNGPASAAKMNGPGGMFIDKHDNLYISDYWNGAIRLVDGSTGIITTIVGGERGYGGDGGPALNAKLKSTDVLVDDYGTIYIADYINQRVRKVNGALKVNSPLIQESQLLLYPNPTKGQFTIETGIKGGIISVCGTNGQMILQQAFINGHTDIDISNEPPGIYMVYIQCGEDRYVSKVLLQ